MEQLSFRLSDFEGPLELLLHLIAKHQLDILEIEIAELLRQYMAFIDACEEQDPEVASEFLEMAARLVRIKTVMLLPRREAEADALRTQLTGELMEYQNCRRLAAELRTRAQLHRVYVRAPMTPDADPLYTLTHPATLLLEGLRSADGRAVRALPPTASMFTGLVKRHAVSVGSRVIHLLRLLYRRPTVAFDDVFRRGSDRGELVATFLALLELMKGGRVTVSDDGQQISFQRLPRKENEEVSV